VRDAAHADGVDVVAAGLAFYALFGIFPSLVALVSLYGIVADPEDVARAVRSLSVVLPDAAQRVLTADLTALIERAPAGLGVSFAVSLLAVLWSSSTAVSALIRAINLAYNVRPRRGFLRRRWLSLALTLGAMTAIGLVVPLVTALPVAFAWLGLRPALFALQPPLLTLLAFAALLVTYRYAPDDAHYQTYRRALPGALFATVSWVLATTLYSAYVAYFGSFLSTYGALAGVIVLCLWLYLSSLVVLFGAELNAEMARGTLPKG
jgi:membrane protein